MYRVEWLQPALDALTAAWLQADQELRQAITAATHLLDETLRRDPTNAEESRDAGVRIHILAPLVIWFQVDPAERIVHVAGVKVYQKRPG